MVVAQKMQHRVRHKVGKLAAVGMAVLLRLRGNVLERDDHVAERYKPRAGVGVLRPRQFSGRKLKHRKAQNVRRAVDLAHLAVDLVNGRIVRQLHVDLAGKVHTLGSKRRADDLADKGALAAAHIGHVFRRNGDIMSLCHHFFLFSFRAVS